MGLRDRIRAFVNWRPEPPPAAPSEGVVLSAPVTPPPPTKDNQSYARMPIQGGRQTVPDSNVGLMSALSAALSEVQPEYPREYIKLVRHLATYNSEVGYALDNIVQLANTPFTVTFDDGVPAKKAKKLKAILTAGEKQLYAGGVNSLVNDLLAQLAVAGTISAEIVPNNRLDDVRLVVLVMPESIVFTYDAKEATYMPNQRANGIIVQGSPGTLYRLNPVTFKYYPLRRLTESPYGLPPFLAALEAITIEKKMICHIQDIAKRLGAFGFLSVLVQAPISRQGETPEAFEARSRAYLDDVMRQAEAGFASGVATGFKGAVEYEMEANTGNVQGVREMMQLISEMKFSGLKQDPLMLGRNYNVAETMAKVILAKLSKQVRNYQALVASFLEDLFALRLELLGQPVGRVTVTFDPPMLSDKKVDEEAEEVRLRNLTTLYKQGIISQQQYAEAAGYEKPFQEGPQPADPAPSADPPPSPGNTAAMRSAELLLQRGTSPFPFEAPSDKPFAFDDKEMQKHFARYLKQVDAAYSKAVKASVKDIVAHLSATEVGNAETVVDSIMYKLFTGWDENFRSPVRSVVRSNVEEAYTAFRKSKTALEGVQNIPEASLDLLDLRAVEYFKNSDTLYLGRFITDPDVKNAVTQYIKQNYIEGDMPIGKNADAVARFRREFGDVLMLKDWKIEQILSTTVNRMRNGAAVNYMGQAGVEKFRIIGIPDSRQTDFCREIDGTVFEVESVRQDFERMMATDPQDISSVSPFGISLIDPDKIKSTDSAELRALGIGTPPYHPNCRSTIIAEI